MLEAYDVADADAAATAVPVRDQDEWLVVVIGVYGWRHGDAACEAYDADIGEDYMADEEGSCEPKVSGKDAKISAWKG